MKEITLNIEENKFETFLSFIKTLDYVSISEDLEVSKWQQEEVRNRLKKIKNGEMEIHDWEEVKRNVFTK